MVRAKFGFPSLQFGRPFGAGQMGCIAIDACTSPSDQPSQHPPAI